MAEVPIKILKNQPSGDTATGHAKAGRSSDIWALIPCAGTGSRAGAATAKQYQMIAGQALVAHTLSAFAAVARIRQTLVLLAQDDTGFARLVPERLHHCIGVVCGGATRAATVFNGLGVLRERGAHDQDWVLVHDAARCLITPALIDRLIDACADDTVGGLLAWPATDTIKRASGERVAQTVDRNAHWLAQTPQMFRLGLLHQALATASEAVTDESSAIEAMGLSPRLVQGDSSNFKVTVAQDFVLAHAVLSARPRQSHTNTQYDYP